MSRFWEFAQLTDNVKGRSHIDRVPESGNLYIGGLSAVYQEPDPLKLAQITHILSVLDFDIQDTRQLAGYKKLFIRVDDDPRDDLLKHFKSTNKFIEAALISGGSIFVHCAMGVSRSATVVCAFLMHKYRISLQDALQRLREGRRYCQPNPGFMEQLGVYEKMLGTTEESQADEIYENWSKGGSSRENGRIKAQSRQGKL